MLVVTRRPAGLIELTGHGAARDLGAYFAEVAYLEAASVVAFRRLEEDLCLHAAPTVLITRARRARADEIRHARETTALAHRFGEKLSPPMILGVAERDLLTIAIHNATEGCVRETYAALVAEFQARCAEDAEIARVLTGIARDEARHADLSHEIAAWFDTLLDGESRALVAAERNAALHALYDGIAYEPGESVIVMAGLPNGREARALLMGLEQEVLAA